MPTPLRTWCTVSFSALRSNLRILRAAAPRGTRILAVVKDNAYGHGLVPVAHALSRAGCEEFGVAFASEGTELRQAGIREPILLLGSPGEARYRHEPPRGQAGRIPKACRVSHPPPPA
ncbi:MAG: hypothetical protein EBT77_02355 [Verrucomicrobia bacterium]|nr:hypothetical protein [Verrucomicrobiota bacterium]